MQTQTELPITRTEWNSVSKISLEYALQLVAIFTRLYPILADRCGDRLQKAVQIMTHAGARKQTEIPGVFSVLSESGHGWYEVDVNHKTCTCPDSQRKDIICKHRLSIGLHLCAASWMTEAMKARSEAVRLAWINVEASTKDLQAIGDQQEAIAIRQLHGLPVRDLELELVRISSLEGQAETDRLLAIYNALVAKPVHEFAA